MLVISDGTAWMRFENDFLSFKPSLEARLLAKKNVKNSTCKIGSMNNVQDLLVKPLLADKAGELKNLLEDSKFGIKFSG